MVEYSSVGLVVIMKKWWWIGTGTSALLVDARSAGSINSVPVPVHLGPIIETTP